MKSCNTCKHKEMSVRYLPCRICIDYCLWNMPTEYKEIFIEELEKIKAEIEDMWIKSAKDLKTGEIIYENLCEHSEVLEILENHISELKGENK